jgi:hypothetical protein
MNPSISDGFLTLGGIMAGVKGKYRGDGGDQVQGASLLEKIMFILTNKGKKSDNWKEQEQANMHGGRMGKRGNRQS